MAVYKGHGKRLGSRIRLMSWLRICHPAVSLAYYAGFSVLVFSYNHPVFILTGFAFAVWHAGYQLGLRVLARKMKLACIFCLLCALLNPILNHQGLHILFYLSDRPVTAESIAYGGYMLLLLLTMLTLLTNLTHTVGTGKLLYLFSRAAPRTSFIAGMTLRYSSYLKKEAENYFCVQKIRDGEAAASRINRLKQGGRLLSGFSAMTLEKGLQTAESLRAKNYGKRARTLYAAYLFTPSDAAALVTFLILCVTSVAFSMNGAGNLDYFRSLSELGLEPPDLRAYPPFVLYLFLPFIVDIIRAVRRSVA